MPTVSEPIRERASCSENLAVEQHALAIVADMLEAGVRITKANVLARAGDIGLSPGVRRFGQLRWFGPSRLTGCPISREAAR